MQELKMLRIILFLGLVLCVHAARLPSYITQCKKDDPKLEECLVHNGNLAIPLLCKGDRHYGIPNMMPLKFGHIVLSNNDDLKFILYDVQVHGIDTANLTHAMLDLEEGTSEYIFNIPSLQVLADNYDLKGRLMNISMYGTGFANITLVGGEYTYAPTFGPRSLEFDELYELGGHNMKYKTNKTIYYLENLFNGGDFQGFDLNLLLNEQWEDVAKVLRPAARQVMGSFINTFITNMLNIVSKDEIFKA